MLGTAQFAQRMGGMSPAKACLLLSLPMVVLFWLGLQGQGGFALGLHALVAPSLRTLTSCCFITLGGRASRLLCSPVAAWDWPGC